LISASIQIEYISLISLFFQRELEGKTIRELYKEILLEIGYAEADINKILR
jgi:predicted nuclease of restriction endonuclease-like (RecB) superfamily